MAKDWADAQGIEENGAIKTLIYGNEDSTQQKERFDAVVASIGEDPRFDVKEVLSLEASTIAAQSATENMFSKYPDVTCVITPAGEMALGVLAYTHSESSPVGPTDVAVFGTELNEEIASYIRDGSMAGTVLNGGVPAESIAEQVDEMDRLISGEEMEHFSSVDMGKVTIENVEEFGY